MQRILHWFGVNVEVSAIEEAISEVRMLLREFSQLQEALRDAISEAGHGGIEQALSQLDNIKEHVFQLCIKNQKFKTYKEKVSNHRMNSSTGTNAAWMLKATTRSTVAVV